MPAVAQQPAAPIRIVDVRVQLFGERTGTFSENLLGPSPPPLGNVMIGEDPANSFLLVVTLDGPRARFERDAILQMTVRTRGGRPSPVTHRVRGLLFGESGRVQQAMMAHHHVCQGAEIDVRIGRERRIIPLGFHCGE